MIHATLPNTVPRAAEIPARLPKRRIQTVRCRYESEQARALLRANALDDFDSLFALAERSLHGHKGRAVSRVELDQPGGEPVPAFVKLHWGRRRLVPRMSDMKTGQAFQNLPVREWEGIADLRSLGLLVPERLALFQRGWIWFQEAVVIKSVRPPFSLDEMIRNGSWDEFPHDDRRAILKGVVAVMQRIHEAGLGWRGTCTRHFFPERTPGGTWQFWLIDCEGVHRNATAKNVARDYKKLNRALAISGADARTLHEFQKLAGRAERRVLNGRCKAQNNPGLALNPTWEPST